MKIIALVTLVVPGKDGNSVEVPPGASTTLPDADAHDLIARKFAAPDGRASQSSAPAGGGEPDILDGSIPEIIIKLEGKSLEELQALRQREVDGKTRKGLIAAIDTAIEEAQAEAEEEEEAEDADPESEEDPE